MLLPYVLFVVVVVVVVVVCHLQPSSSVNSCCPGPGSSILASSRWACPISSHVTDHRASHAIEQVRYILWIHSTVWTT